jgi:hypothetical protein
MLVGIPSALVFFLGVLSNLTTVFGGSLWPTNPEIHARENLSGSSFRLPFTIKNVSAIPIVSAEMTCGIDWVYFKDANGSRANFAQIAFTNDVISIEAGQTINYECDASHLIKAYPDGSWELRGVSGPGNLIYPPLDFRRMCLWMRGDYKIANLIPWSFTSAMFQWPSGPGVYQWTEGPLHTAGQITQDEWIERRAHLPADVVRCSDKPHVVAMLFDREGKPHMTLAEKVGN